MRGKKYKIEEVRVIAEANGSRCLSSDYKNKYSVMTFQCIKCSRIWDTMFSSVLHGSGCPDCGLLSIADTLKKYSLEDCQKMAINFGGKCLATSFETSHTMMPWECSLGHHFNMRLFQLMDGYWCPTCYHNSEARFDHSLKECQEVAASKGGECLSTHYLGTDKLMQWRCNIHGIEWTAQFHGILFGNWCPKCAITRREETKLVKYGDPNYTNPEKKKKTMLERYGVEHGAQNREISLRMAKNANYSCTLTHWKTGEEIVCRGSYEKKVVEGLNRDQVDFTWQIPFALSDGKTYICDLYIPIADTYVEIKGWWRDDARRKYLRWCQEYPQLRRKVWDKPLLKAMGVDV
jgi:hypothetical protein